MVDRLIAALFFILLFTIGGCDSGTTAARSLKDIKDSGTLIVLSENAPTIWYIDREGNPTGPEYDMMTSFAEHLGVEVEFEIEDSLKDIFEELDKGNGDLAAATITITPERQKKYLFSKPYPDVTQQVVCRRDNVQPESVAE
ncbi:MAG: transporter substrate-binding domain-containing protein, partial [Gammaproteobacteria bacterium]